MRCRTLHRVANPAYIDGFLCSGLSCVAPYCAAGGINIASTPRFTGSDQPIAGIRSTCRRYRSSIRGLQRMAQMFPFPCLLVFEPIGDHSPAGVDIDVPGPSGTGVDELVWRAGRGDHDPAAGCLDGLVSHREGQFALLHHEEFVVGVLVQIRSLAGGRVRKEERDVHVAVLVALELVHAPVVGKLVVGDQLRHVSSWWLTGNGRGAQPCRTWAAEHHEPPSRSSCRHDPLSLPRASLQSVTLPPATSSVTPVIQEELSEARKRVASATSSGVPSRLSGICSEICRCCSSGMKRRVRSTSTVCGARQLTRMPCLPTSFATWLVSMI